MYPLSNDYNHHYPNPISLSEDIIPHMPLFISDNNPNSKLEDLHLPSSFHYPSPVFQYADVVHELTWQQLHDLFIQQQPFTPENSVAEMNINNPDDPKHDAVDVLKQGRTEKCAPMPPVQIMRKRSSKKDRHSKITTAKGPRDRRMRLSLDVARKFFDLQDILGFDKASKTVEWLMIQSNSAIKGIMRGLPRMRYDRASVGANTSVSSTSECEVLSGIDDATTTNDNKQASIGLKMTVKSSSKGEKKAKLARRTTLHLLARESRKIARERARKRTMEKRKIGETKSYLEARKSDLKQLGSWVHIAAVEESGRRGSKINPCTTLEGLKEVEELNSDQEPRAYADDDILGITGTWNSTSICNYKQDAEVPHHVVRFLIYLFLYCF